MRYAVNISDLTCFGSPSIGVSLLLSSLIAEPQEIVHVEKGRVDGSAVVLQGDSLQVLCAISILQRKGAELKRRLLPRAYVEGPRGGWSKLPDLKDKTLEELAELSVGQATSTR